MRRRVKWILLALIATCLVGAYYLSIFAFARQDHSKDDHRLKFTLAAIRGKLENYDGEKRDDPYIPTGDALTDAYSAVVLARLNSAECRAHLELAAAAPDAELLKLEPQFGGDPRYWELRYWCALGRKSAHPTTTADPVSFLREARRRGAASAVTLLLLHAEQAGAPVLRKQKWIPPADLPAEVALLKEAAAKAPASAWPHYALAAMLYREGKPAGGLNELKIGNAKSECVAPFGFPIDALSGAVAGGQPLGNRQFTGAVVMLQFGSQRDPVQDVIRTARARIKQQGGSLEEQNEWLHCAVRSMRGAEFEVSRQLSALVILKLIADQGSEGTKLAPFQVQNCKRLLGACEQMLDARRTQTTDPITAALDSVARYGAEGTYIGMATEPMENAALFKKNIAPVLADIAQFDLTADEPSPSLAGYEAVTVAQLKQRHKERHDREIAADKKRQR
jgi:hypothetical protein